MERKEEEILSAEFLENEIGDSQKITVVPMKENICNSELKCEIPGAL